MYQQRISTSESPRIEVTACQGDLAVATWDSSEVLIEVETEEALTVERREDTVALAAKGDCRLTVPPSASLVVVQAQGDLSVQGVDGTVEVTTAQGNAQFKDGSGSASLSTVQANLMVVDWAAALSARSVQGDVELRQVGGDVNLGQVSGDLTAEDIRGALSASSVGGDAYLRQLRGPLSLSDVGVDLGGRDWMAGAEVAQVDGDVSLKSAFAGRHTYRIQARGDIIVKAFSGSNATFTLQAPGGRVRAKGLTGEMMGEQWQGAIGGGEAQVMLSSSRGRVTLKAVDEADEERAAFAFAAEFDETGAAEELAQRIQQRVAEKLSKIDFEAIARREAERARRQAEGEAERARRVAEKVRRKAERARRKAERKRWRIEWDAERSKPRAAGPGEEVTEEERLTVLKMLAESKISAEEADMLLQALEG